MNRFVLMATLLAAVSLTACDRPAVVGVPVPVAVPGPAGPTGATGEAGKDGKGTTLIVVPPAPASAPN